MDKDLKRYKNTYHGNYFGTFDHVDVMNATAKDKLRVIAEWANGQTTEKCFMRALAELDDLFPGVEQHTDVLRIATQYEPELRAAYIKRHYMPLARAVIR